jgi:hypothetical protein
MSYSLNGSITAVLKNLSMTPAGTNSSFTLFCWLQTADGQPAATAAIYNIGTNNVTSSDYARSTLSVTGAVQGTVTGSVARTALLTTALAPNGVTPWMACMLACTVNGSNQITLATQYFYNGTTVATPVSTGAIAETINPAFSCVSFGGRINGSDVFSQPFTGKIAHAAIWASALTSGDFDELCGTGAFSGVGGKTPDLVGIVDLLAAADRHRQRLEFARPDRGHGGSARYGRRHDGD